MCLQVTTHYNINNDLQHYLWPLRVIAKAKLTPCSKPSEKISFMPIKNLKVFVLTGSLNVLVCVSGCIFHFIRLIMFCALGKVMYVCVYACVYVYVCIGIHVAMYMCACVCVQ